jgi:hypothetical protein
MSRSGPRRPSGIVGTEGGVASAGVGDEIVAYRVDMRFLILSSTRDLRTFFSGLDSLAAGFGPLRVEALLRRDSIVVVVVVAAHESRPGAAQVRLDEDTLVPSTICPHVSPLSLILPFARHKAP